MERIAAQVSSMLLKSYHTSYTYSSNEEEKSKCRAILMASYAFKKQKIEVAYKILEQHNMLELLDVKFDQNEWRIANFTKILKNVQEYSIIIKKMPHAAKIANYFKHTTVQRKNADLLRHLRALSGLKGKEFYKNLEIGENYHHSLNHINVEKLYGSWVMNSFTKNPKTPASILIERKNKLSKLRIDHVKINLINKILEKKGRKIRVHFELAMGPVVFPEIYNSYTNHKPVLLLSEKIYREMISGNIDAKTLFMSHLEWGVENLYTRKWTHTRSVDLRIEESNSGHNQLLVMSALGE